MRILIIDREPSIVQVLKLCLEEEYYTVDTATDGKEGCFLALTNDYDLIILETYLPQKNGFTICKELRDREKKIPILVLSSNNSIETKVSYLDAGVDDYLTKPFSRQELIARVKALLRRPHTFAHTIYKIANLIVDTEKCEVIRDGKSIYLTRKEFSLFTFLVKNKGTVVTRGNLMEHVWDRYIDPFSNTIETHILNLRKKIDRGFKNKLIHTIPGRGYKVDTVG